jgi:hypothetical protein
LKKALFFFLAFSLWFVSAALAEISLRCEVDKKTISINEELVYKLILSSSKKNIPAPEPPAFAGFDILSQAQSSTVVFAPGSVKNLLVYTYILVPLQPGKIKIEPATITTKERTYTCEEIEIEVTGNSRRPDSQPQEKHKPLPEKGLSDSGGPQITL